MLSESDNRRLTQVGPKTPMGELLRRYWQPIAATADLEHQRVRPLRLMGEDLVLYRGGGDRYGLLARNCTHRSADLADGFVEGDGLRCSYHGWLFGPDGSCLAQPYDDLSGTNAKLRAKAATTAYEVREKAGLLWAYLGPPPTPELSDWEAFSWPNGFIQIVFAEVPCNWFQCQENSIDPVHFEWLHDNWGSIVLQNRPAALAPAHIKLSFEEFEHGFVYRRVREDTGESNDLWRIGRVFLWPNALYIGDHFEWRVPIDDENTLSVTWIYTRVPQSSEPFRQERIPAWSGPVIDPSSGRPITSHIMNQDFAAWIGQGRIADRRRENLGRSDRGITMVRRRFFADMQAIAQGEDPKAVLRDPAANRRVRLPIARRDLLERAPTHDEVCAERKYWHGRGIPDDYIYQAGQPDDVHRAYLQAMGLTEL
jgi:5,5'-dehydrodivanillate O-demethylase oxygenase subunit